MKKIRKISVMLIALFALLGCASKTAETIDINDDKVPSVYAIIGEKKITGTNSKIENGVRTTILTYGKNDLSYDEVVKYTETLIDDHNYILTQQVEDQADGSKEWVIANDSVTEGHIVLVAFHYSEEGETIIDYVSGEGTLTRYE